MNGNVFINYRREDSAGITGRIHDRLARSFPAKRLFIDVDNIAPGQNFTALLDQQVAQCDVLLAVIGPSWTHLSDDAGTQRLANPADFVRIEIASALKRKNISVIPVLVDGAQMPTTSELPDDLQPLVERNAIEISSKRFHRDTERLIRAIRQALPFGVRYHRPIRALKWATLAASVAGAFYWAVLTGALPTAFGLEQYIRPAAREWARFSYADKTNPALLDDFSHRHAAVPEAKEARRWYDFVASRTWSKIRAQPDPDALDDFLLTFRTSDERPEAEALKPTLPGTEKSTTRFRDCQQCPEMVALPAGTFAMGSLESEHTDDVDKQETPVQAVTIAQPFAIGRLEVTVGQFKLFVKETGHDMGERCLNILDPSSSATDWGYVSGRTFKTPGFPQNDDHPVVCVSWEDASAYTAWLSAKTGAKYRLPSEAEWEYAARAGSRDSYAFGDDESRLCQYANGADRGLNWEVANRWCADGYRIGTAPAGSYLPNAFGLRDMHGNVHEWVTDCYHPTYSAMPDATRNTGAAWATPACPDRVIRGGCWAYPAPRLRSARRERWTSNQRSFCVGFRVAKSLQERK